MNSFFKNFGLFLTGLIASAAVLSPSYREHFLSLIDRESRQTLATLTLHAGQNQFKVVKLRKDKHILIEIYKINADNDYTLAKTFDIPDARDVAYDFHASVSNLFSANIDSDEGEEVIVPVLDKNLVAHLSVIKFDPAKNEFEHYAF